MAVPTPLAALEKRAPALAHFASLFAHDHLPDQLREISAPVADLVEQLIPLLPDNPETTAGLRKLLEAKDALVRARVLAG